MRSTPRSPARRPDPRVLRPVRQLALAGLALVMVWPAARGHALWLGWLPLWLVGMPCMAWWALYGFPLPRLGRTILRAPERRRRAPQARRWRRRTVQTVSARTA
ncbi:hypothetical protein [[Pseudomonas] boreopolis]|uniref:hypothetical protein n=1 Tax=Xanthomonas boreopolis TaxID=86183 RepID=UPI003D5232B0